MDNFILQAIFNFLNANNALNKRRQISAGGDGSKGAAK